MSAAAATIVEVRARAGEPSGVLRLGGRAFDCALGRAGIAHPKHEGDGGTPAGLFPLREVRYRADRLGRPATGLADFPILETDGWCDDPADPDYNRLVAAPRRTSCETLWRADGLYDVLAVIGCNDAPVVPGAGSAIFMHVAGNTLPPTEGCVALALQDLLAVLASLGPGSVIDIRRSP